MKKIHICLLLIILRGFCAGEAFEGIWENDDRFIEWSKKDGTTSEYMMRTVLKPYYRYAYEDQGIVKSIIGAAQKADIYVLDVFYPHTKEATAISFWLHNDNLFSSYYERYAVDEENSFKSSDSVQFQGFWIEQGCRNGIFIYPQEVPDFFDAFFFTEHDYIRFRYWKDDLDYKKTFAMFQQKDGQHIGIPKLLQRNNAVYTCITGNGSKLKNYERGTYTIIRQNNILFLTLIPQQAGPGSHAASDVYPHTLYPAVKELQLYYDEKGGAFSFGIPFLKRSKITALDEAIKTHNSLKRPRPEPQLQADLLDFQWEHTKSIRNKKN